MESSASRSDADRRIRRNARQCCACRRRRLRPARSMAVCADSREPVSAIEFPRTGKFSGYFASLEGQGPGETPSAQDVTPNWGQETPELCEAEQRTEQGYSRERSRKVTGAVAPVRNCSRMSGRCRQKARLLRRRQPEKVSFADVRAPKAICRNPYRRCRQQSMEALADTFEGG